jgi:ABC-type lipoprotein release transport system permease subunit
MDDHTLLLILIVLVAIVAISFLGQAIAMFGMLSIARDIRTKMLAVWPDVESMIGTSKRSIDTAEKHMASIGASSVAILEVTKQQLAKVDELLTDASMRAKVQMERAEMVMDDTMTKVQETVTVVQRGVLRPVREMHGLLVGVRMAFAHLSRSARPTVDHATSDEEMFI